MGKSKQNKQKTWEEKLEMLLSDNDCNCFVVNKDLKSFISAELQRARKEIKDRVIELIDGEAPGDFGDMDKFAISIIKKIRDEQEFKIKIEQEIEKARQKELERIIGILETRLFDFEIERSDQLKNNREMLAYHFDSMIIAIQRIIEELKQLRN